VSDKIILGDCLSVMKDLPDDCVDSIVTDPPYGLEFMGKEWDSFKGGEKWRSSAGMTKPGIGERKIAWPSYGGSDTANATCATCGGRVRGAKVCSCEKPDWRVKGVQVNNNSRAETMRTFQAWCETWASEALRVAKPGAHLVVFGGTRTYHRLAVAIEDAGWEIRDSLMWLYGCLSEDTEILVNGAWEPYHRATAGCLALCFDTATGSLGWQPISQLYVYDYDDTAYRIASERTDQIVSRNHRCIVERNGRWEFVVAERLEENETVPVLEEDPLCRVQGGGVEASLVGEARCETNVLSGVQRSAARGGVGEARAQGAGGVDGGDRRVVSREDARATEPGVEGRGNVLPQARELQADQVRPLPTGVPADGAQGRVRHGAPPASCACDGPLSTSSGDGSPCEPRPDGQRTDELGTVQVESGSQTVRASRIPVADMARVTPFHYIGKVWCVKVPTGAFVARRNGKVFITGNSGFPKSHDVSNAIEAHILTGKSDSTRTASGQARDRKGQHWSEFPARKRVTEEPLLTTDDAKQWTGWGTALKPAYEPIILARKPLIGTVAANVLKHGTGGLNIDGCRIPVQSGDTKGGYCGESERVAGAKRSGGEDATNFAQRSGDPLDGKGRWPANLVLDEEAAAALDGQSGTRVSGSGAVKRQTAANRSGNGGAAFGAESRPEGTPMISYGDSGGASRFFYCAKSSRSERTHNGKVDNKHPTVKPLALMRWLVKLITPPGGSVLDPFAGSGSTLVAAELEGFDYLGIEQDPESHRTACERLLSRL